MPARASRPAHVVGNGPSSKLTAAVRGRSGINRMGFACEKVGEAEVHATLDLSGRPHLGFEVDFADERVGEFDTQLVEHTYQSLANNSGMTLHVRKVSGSSPWRAHAAAWFSTLTTWLVAGVGGRDLGGRGDSGGACRGAGAAHGRAVRRAPRGQDRLLQGHVDAVDEWVTVST
jgi:hypothetical protein